jgi:hypothetical protein
MKAGLDLAFVEADQLDVSSNACIIGSESHLRLPESEFWPTSLRFLCPVFRFPPFSSWSCSLVLAIIAPANTLHCTLTPQRCTFTRTYTQVHTHIHTPRTHMLTYTFIYTPQPQSLCSPKRTPAASFTPNFSSGKKVQAICAADSGRGTRKWNE